VGESEDSWIVFAILETQRLGSWGEGEGLSEWAIIIVDVEPDDATTLDARTKSTKRTSLYNKTWVAGRGEIKRKARSQEIDRRWYSTTVGPTRELLRRFACTAFCHAGSQLIFTCAAPVEDLPRKHSLPQDFSSDV